MSASREAGEGEQEKRESKSISQYMFTFSMHTVCRPLPCSMLSRLPSLLTHPGPAIGGRGETTTRQRSRRILLTHLDLRHEVFNGAVLSFTVASIASSAVLVAVLLLVLVVVLFVLLLVLLASCT